MAGRGGGGGGGGLRLKGAGVDVVSGCEKSIKFTTGASFAFSQTI